MATGNVKGPFMAHGHELKGNQSAEHVLSPAMFTHTDASTE